MDYAINSFDQANTPYTRWNAREGHSCRAAEVTEAEPSIGGEDRVTISHAARRMREESDKESEVAMIGSVDSTMGTETAKAAAAAKAGQPAESFDQYLGDAALPEDDKASKQVAAKPEDVQTSEQAVPDWVANHV
jgi:hypothetical protein